MFICCWVLLVKNPINELKKDNATYVSVKRPRSYHACLVDGIETVYIQVGLDDRDFIYQKIKTVNYWQTLQKYKNIE